MESDTDDLLIGMDIIGQGHFLLSYDPTVDQSTLSFSIPHLRAQPDPS